LAKVLFQRFQLNHSSEDLDTAINFFEQAHALQPDLDGVAKHLVSAHFERFGQTGAISDLDHAVKLCREALTRDPLPSLYHNELIGILEGAGVSIRVQGGLD
jgi:tetratricopeptide (TPR) repeat protein